MDNKIPLIHTMESDMDEYSHNENSPVLAAQQQVEGRILPPIDDTSNSKWKLILRVFLIILVLIGVGFAAYKLTTVKKEVAPVAKVVVQSKVWGVSDIWPSMSGALASSTGEATSSSSFVLITINDFNTVYEEITQNEDKIGDLSSKYFDVFELSTFTTQQINNVDLHISDGGDKPIIYGYAGQKYFILTTSISDFFKLYEKLGGNANQNS